MLATALVGLYGLRPAELGALVVEDGDLKVRSTVKRNSKTLGQRVKAPRLVQPLDIPVREGEGQRMLALWRSGMVQLPAALLKRINEVDAKGWKPVGIDTSCGCSTTGHLGKSSWEQFKQAKPKDCRAKAVKIQSDQPTKHIQHDSIVLNN